MSNEATVTPITFDARRFGLDFYTDIIALIKGQGKEYIEHDLSEKEMISFFITPEMIKLEEGPDAMNLAQFQESEKRTTLIVNDGNGIVGKMTGIKFAQIEYSWWTHFVNFIHQDENGKETVIRAEFEPLYDGEKLPDADELIILRIVNYNEDEEPDSPEMDIFIPKVGAVLLSDKEIEARDIPVLQGADMMEFIGSKGYLSMLITYMESQTPIVE